MSGWQWWVNWTVQLVSFWGIRIVVVSSLAAQLVLVIFAGIRRREASSWMRALVWLAYQVVARAPTYALGHLFVGSTSREQQLVAFWAPFLLLHIGGADNISAYSFEDKKLSGRQMQEALKEVGGVVSAIYVHIYMGCDAGTLLPASLIMLTLASAKYLESAVAQWRRELNGTSSSHNKPESIGEGGGGDWELDDEDALQIAHAMFPTCRRAMGDSSVDEASPELVRSRKIVSFGWKNMCKVVEMEASLMYDVLYTKAAVVHTWVGYSIRLVAPFATATASLLFWLYQKTCENKADVIITYGLLAAELLLDIRWLFSALGSTWTRAFLIARPRCWLHHAGFCEGRWRRLRRMVVAMDLRRLLPRLIGVVAPNSCTRKTRAKSSRRWSGTLGQYNLLRVCARDKNSLGSRLAKMVGLEDSWNEYSYSDSLTLPQDVKGMVFTRVQEVLKLTYNEPEPKLAPLSPKKGHPCKDEITPCPDPDPDPCPCPYPYPYPYPYSYFYPCPYPCPYPMHQHSSCFTVGFLPPYCHQVIVQSSSENIEGRCECDAPNGEGRCECALAAAGSEPGEVKKILPHISKVPIKVITSSWGQWTARHRGEKLRKFLPAFGREFREDILVWHIATHVFLLCTNQQPPIKGTDAATHWEGIMALSEYLMFLAVVRPSMLPGLQLRSLYKESHDALNKIWREEARKSNNRSCRRRCNSTAEEEKLAWFLHDKHAKDGQGSSSPETLLVSDAASLATELLKADESEMPELLEFVFNVWVEKLFHASAECSGESHANQLSRGGELTTILRILEEHAGLFEIGQRGPDSPDKSEEKTAEDKPKWSPQETHSEMYDKPKDSRRRSTRYATLYPV